MRLRQRARSEVEIGKRVRHARQQPAQHCHLVVVQCRALQVQRCALSRKHRLGPLIPIDLTETRALIQRWKQALHPRKAIRVALQLARFQRLKTAQHVSQRPGTSLTQRASTQIEALESDHSADGISEQVLHFFIISWLHATVV